VERSLFAGIAVFRVITFAWMVGVVALTWGDLARPWHAGTLSAMVFAVTVGLTVAVVQAPDSLLRPCPRRRRIPSRRASISTLSRR
jgi:hypothetical protein